ncbi:M23 family metallopeptidase [Actinomycetospora lemnae]|uniref:M23 family metallopeptidase n=1 Tax=Actinomycetospora lemnae TaxID=3019891 RepID=A0ABT5SXD3_9PSEU|nr:M23 family metallopeptidase [Actinomycetospora sp. DW7H6]MDD7967386.1 M23 family metallopeptidase [Actinomycetospora sp. DW7H6]
MGALLVAVTVLTACGGSGAGATPPPSASTAAGAATAEGPFGGPSAADAPAGGVSVFTPVAASVLAAPIPVPATDGRVHLAYELQVDNILSSPATLTAVEVVGDGRSLLRLDGEALAAWVKPFGGSPGTRDLQAGQGGLIWLDVSLAATDPVPARLEHRLDVAFAQPSPPLVPPTLSATVAPTTVDRTPPMRISPPLAGSGWVDGDSCCTLGAHRGAVSPIDGRLWAPERFAIDYVQADASGRMLVGPATDMASYPYHGADVLAVADGPVVGLVSDLPEQPPGANPSGLTLQQYGGNHVVQDLGGGRYAFYAHLQPGNPMGLAIGQQLRRGQVIGKLGNSGNTSAPHLHFHVMDRTDPLAANGVPFAFDAFTLEARVTSDEAVVQASEQPVPFPMDRAGAGPRTGVSPLSLDVMGYPAAP